MLKKDLFVIMKGYMCNYNFIQGPFAVVLNGLCNYSFSGGCLCKISVHLMHGSHFACKSAFEVKLL